ncbi:MAG: hypothetical protein LWY06_03625 [Firmicutes bacterium]|nr:hypothetical protein [Bacillota bacterium]
MDENHDDFYKADIPESAPVSQPVEKDKASAIDYNKFENLEQGRISTRLPVKVKSGSITTENITLNTALGTKVFPWESVELIALGMINEEIDTGKAPKSKMRSLINQFLVGEQNRPSAEKKNVRDFCLIDIFVKDEECQYRIDQSIVNYRGFIEKTGYVSADNFNKLIRKLAFHAKFSKFDNCLVVFLTKTKADVKKHPSIVDFELDVQAARRNIETLRHRSELEFKWENQ